MVHLSARIRAKVTEPVVVALPATVPEQVALVIGELDYADAQPVEEVQPVQVILDRRGVLPSKDDTSLAATLGIQDVLSAGDLREVRSRSPKRRIQAATLSIA